MAEGEHEIASVNTLLLIALILVALVFAYLIKKYKFYYVPESAAAMLVSTAASSTWPCSSSHFLLQLGVLVGGIAKAVAGETEMEFLRFKVRPCYASCVPSVSTFLSLSLPCSLSCSSLYCFRPSSLRLRTP